MVYYLHPSAPFTTSNGIIFLQLSVLPQILLLRIPSIPTRFERLLLRLNFWEFRAAICQMVNNCFRPKKIGHRRYLLEVIFAETLLTRILTIREMNLKRQKFFKIGSFSYLGQTICGAKCFIRLLDHFHWSWRLHTKNAAQSDTRIHK